MLSTNRVADLTVEEFQALIRGTLLDLLRELLNQDDPDE